MTYGGRFFYVNILLIVKCVMKFFYVIASIRGFSRHCEYMYVGSSNTSLRVFVVFHVIASIRMLEVVTRHCEAS